MTQLGRSWRRCITAVAVLLACGWTASPAGAQNYQSATPKIDAKQAKQLEARVGAILRDTQAPNPDALKALDDFFNGYYYRAMTNTDPLALGQLGETRVDLFRRYINAAKSTAARDHLIGLTLKTMTSIATRPFHPAVRYNAALIIGQLDQQPGAKPLPAATEALVSLLESDKVSTPVKSAALVGLQRHTALGVEPPLAERITTAALAMANRAEPPEDVTSRVYGWIKRQAAQVLANQFAKGITPPVHSAFVAMISDEKSDLDDRCDAAGLLVPTMYQNAQGIDAEAMMTALGRLAREVLEIESEDAEEYLEEVVAAGEFAPAGGGYGGEGRMMGGYGGRGGYGGEGGGFGALEPLEPQGPHYEKRSMLERVRGIVAAADALRAGGSDELKARLDEFSKAITAAAQTIANDDTLELDVAEAVVNLAEDVDRMVMAWSPAEEPAEEGGDEFEVPAGEPAEEAEEAEPADQPPVEEAAGGN
jgi:hypothetical protein